MEVAAEELGEWSGADLFTGVSVDGSPVGGCGSSDVQRMEIEDGSTVCGTTCSLSGGEDFTAAWRILC